MMMTHVRKSKRLSTMKHFLGTIAFLMMFGQGVIGAATARPLEHSPSELAWDAWVHDSKQMDPQPPPRRITTKSLFVFPDVPGCAEGYRPDSLGRCVKVVRVDETAHLEFLLQKLNSQFATETSESQDDLYDYDLDTEAPETSGPFQLNIPIAMQVQAPKPEDSEGSGDEVIVFKKEAPMSIVDAPRPTSSPEYIPGDIVNNKENDPEPQPSVEPQKNQTEHQNATTPGMTILVSTNGKFENVTTSDSADNNGSETKLVDELKDVKDDIKDVEANIDLEKIVTEVVDAAASSILKTLLKEVSKATNKNTDDSMETVKDKKDVDSPMKTTKTDSTVTSGKIDEPDKLIEQIEALKDIRENGTDVETSPIVQEHSAHDTSNKTGDILNNIVKANANSTYSVDLATDDSKINVKVAPVTTKIDLDVEKGLKLGLTEPMDIEEKIKVISRFADVTRNTEENPHVPNYEEKKTPNNQEIYPNVPQPYRIPNFYHNPVDQAVPPSNIVRFPEVPKPIPNNHIGSQEQLTPYDKQHPYNNLYKNDYNSGNFRHKTPYWWLPNNWNIEQPKDDHNLMSFWSRMPLVPEYPYVTNPEHNRHPQHYQSLYPNPHEASGRINLRHTSINHRRGRLYNRDRQTEHEEPIVYARGRHPHYRE